MRVSSPGGALSGPVAYGPTALAGGADLRGGLMLVTAPASAAGDRLLIIGQGPLRAAGYRRTRGGRACVSLNFVDVLRAPRHVHQTTRARARVPRRPPAIRQPPSPWQESAPEAEMKARKSAERVMMSSIAEASPYC